MREAQSRFRRVRCPASKGDYYEISGDLLKYDTFPQKKTGLSQRTNHELPLKFNSSRDIADPDGTIVN